MYVYVWISNYQLKKIIAYKFHNQMQQLNHSQFEIKNKKLV